MKKIIASILAAFFIMLSPISAYAAATSGSMMMFSTGIGSDEYSVMPLNVPTNSYFLLTPLIKNVDTNTVTSYDSLNIIDDNTTSIIGVNNVSLSNVADNRVGIKFSDRNVSPFTNFTMTNHIDMNSFALRLNDLNSVNTYTLSPYATPSEAYVVYTGLFDYKIYDGSVNYDRWIYDNSFTFIKPISVTLSNFGQHYIRDNGAYNPEFLEGCQLSIDAEFLTKSDIFDIVAYSNDISDGTQFTDNEIEDFSYDSIRLSVVSADYYVFYDINNSNFVPLSWQSGVIHDISDLINFEYYCMVQRSPFNDNCVSLNVYQNQHEYSNDTTLFGTFTSSFGYMTSRISLLISNLSANMGDIVTNATNNADRIIQNTTNKINEVKQGVTDVKNSVIETKNSILDLPNKIKDMLLGLIVPSSETMANKYSEFSHLLEQKLGIIYQIPMMLFSFFDTIVNAATTPQSSLTLPAFTLPWIDGTTLTIWEPIEYKIIPDGMQVLSDLIQTVTSMTVVVLTFNSVKQAYERFLRS